MKQREILFALVVSFQAVARVSSGMAGCPPACSSCTKSTKTCLACDSGYFLSPYKDCQACPPSCASCTASSCLSCQRGYGVNSESGKCEICPPTCATCRNNICTSCGYLSYLTRTGECAACPSNCLSCSASGCLLCNTGYGLDTTTGQCGNCAPNCNQCRFAGTCLSTACSSRFKYNPSTQLCDACAPYCNICPSANTCYDGQCETGTSYDPIYKNCTKCPANCDYCYSNGTCFADSCQYRYRFNWTTLSCEAFEGCPLNCNYCLTSETCLPNECARGSVFNETTGLCDSCAYGCTICLSAGTCLPDGCGFSKIFDDISQTCEACSQNCRYCSKANTCDPYGCDKQYEFNSTSQACEPTITCASHCYSCTSQGTCSPNMCFNGYAFDEVTQTCLACAANCRSCATAGICDPDGCDAQYEYNSTTQSCEKMMTCSANCRFCSAANTCDPYGCTAQYEYNNETLSCDISKACAPNCNSCTSKGTCLPTSCERPYAFDPITQTCLRCAPGCYSCSAPETCYPNQCHAKFAFNATSLACSPCAEFCSLCTSPGTCLSTSCDTGFIFSLSSQTCIACAPYCTSCTSPGTCLSNACYSGFGYNETTQTCVACAPYCSSCTSQGTCLPNWCNHGYAFDEATRTCKQCQPSCKFCNTPGTCMANGCVLGYAFDIESQTCLPCADNCNVCASPGTCVPEGCASGYTYDFREDIMQPCFSCDVGKATCISSQCNNLGFVGRYAYDADNQKCVACKSFCTYCLPDGSCIPNSCQSLYAFNAVTKACEPCDPHCSSCATPGTCSPNKCVNRYAYDEASKKCLACAPNCNFCTLPGVCSRGYCDSNYVFDEMSQTCLLCANNCYKCTTAGTCLPNQCKEGFAFNTLNKKCDACSSNCYSCTSPGTCTPNMCYQKFALNDASQTCQPCSSSCLYCATPGTCSPNGCYNQFAFNITTKTCNPCAPSCTSCSSPGTCSQGSCYDGFAYNVTTLTCQPCASSCSACALPGTCIPTKCLSGYGFDEATQTCMACASSCSSCTSPGTCSPSTCYERFAYDAETQKCLPCAPYCTSCKLPGTCAPNTCNQYYGYNETSQTCLPCSPACYSCKSAATCLPSMCYERYAFDVASETCQPCSSYCRRCITPHTCIPSECDSRYAYNVNTQSCQGCISGCTSCNSPNTCNIGNCESIYSPQYGFNGVISSYMYYTYNMTTNTCDECAPYCSGCIVTGTCLPSKCVGPNYVYDVQSQTCKANSLCNLQSGICNYRGECVSDSATTYTCNCFKGFAGPQCADITNSPFYPYGSAAKDNVLLRTDDGSTPRILLDPSFLFYGRFLASVFINMNGFISFSDNYLSYRPMLFPHDNSEDADLLAPFWSDADSSGISCDCSSGCSSCGTGVVYYHIYKLNPNEIYATNSVESKVFNLTTLDGQAYIPGFKKADWVMVVTWTNVIPYPYLTNKDSTERNTFQAILAMDTKNIRSFVSFRYGENHWRDIRPAMMGIQAIKSNFYYNFGNPYILSSASGSGTTASYEIGMAMFDTSGSTSPTAGQKCLYWVANEVERKPRAAVNIGSLPPCPCSGFQAMFSPSHVYMPGTDCFVTTNSKGNAMKCCYDRNAWMWSYYWIQWSWMWTYVWLGNLVVDPIYEAGGFYEKNPYYNPRVALVAEDKAKKDCCLLSANCPSYFSVRPINNCDGFRSPIVRPTFGDPHISTHDGQLYDYNGIGEYWMIKSPDLYLQGRTMQATDANNKPVAASVFGAYAIQVPQSINHAMSDCIFLRMVSEENLELYINPNSVMINLTDWVRNGTNVSSSDDSISTYNGFVLKRLGAAKGVIVNIAEGTLLIFRLEAGQLGLSITGGQVLFNNTRGLLGTYDGDVKNEYTLRNGSVLPVTSSPQTIYKVFGDSWRITADESLMYYEAGKNTVHYQNASFTPMFTPTFTSASVQKAATALCGSNAQCLLDYAVTGNAKMATATINNNDRTQSVNKVFSSSQPAIKGPQLLRITVGQKFSSTYSVSNADKSAVTLSMSGLPTGATFNPTSGVFTWTPSKMMPVVNLSVDAISANGVPARSIAVAVLMCSGCANHGSCDFNTTTPNYRLSYRYQVVTCTCNDGYRGDNCNVTDDYCASKPCGENATCVNLPPGRFNEFNLAYNCTKCRPGQHLSRGKCIDDAVIQIDGENKDNACSSMPCQNNASCQATSSEYVCTCSPDFSGINCENSLITTVSTTSAMSPSTSPTTKSSSTTKTTTIRTTVAATQKNKVASTKPTIKPTTTTIKTTTTTANPFYERLRQIFG